MIESMDTSSLLSRGSAGLEIKIKSLSLDQFRGFNKLPDLTFGDNVTVILSENGGGKTTILDAVASMLQVFANQLIKTEYSIPQVLNKKNIKNGTLNAYVQLGIEIKKNFYHEPEPDDDGIINSGSQNIYDSTILEEKTISGSVNMERCEYRIEDYIADHDSEFSFGNYFKHEYRQGDYLPILVYYGCNSIDTNSELSKPIVGDKIYHLYADSLVSRRFSFDSFLRWFDYLYKTRHLGDGSNLELDLITKVAYTLLNDDENGVVFSNLRMSYQLDRDVLLIDKKNTDGNIVSVEIDQMSSGEKIMFALAADIAKKLMIANPDLLYGEGEISPLHGQGVVLIDEIDLHLHPKWQRLILPKLLHLFPNVQFVVTTHSPFIIQSIKPEQTKILIIKDGLVGEIESAYHYGRDIASIAYDLQGVQRRLPEVQKEINFMYELIDKNQLNEARNQISKLKKYLSDLDEDIISATTIINFIEEE